MLMSDPDRITCTTCKGADREEVLVLCGNEGGTVGCGAACHIDCMEPAMRSIPKDDWLCPRCQLAQERFSHYMRA